MSNISGGNNPCPEGLIYDSSLNMCIHSGGGYFRCHCTVPNPPYVNVWEKYYDKTSDMYDDLKEMCMISGGCNRI